MLSPHLKSCLGLTLALAAAGSLFAQTDTPTTPPAEPPVVLSEFNVTSDGANGYLPTESTAGSRVAVKIKDLPYAVNVVTTDFLKDFNIFDFNEASGFVSSINGLDQGGNFNVRGFSGNVTLRNGFARVGNFDTNSLDRIEFIKGPAAAIYGQTQPGGIINMITKTPPPAPTESISAAYGAYHASRASAEVGGPLWTGSNGAKLSYVADVTYYHRDYEGPAQPTFDKSAYLDLVYQLSRSTDFSFDFDYSFTHNNQITLPEQIDPSQPTTSPHYFTGLATSIVKEYYANSSDWNERIIFNYEGIFEHRFNDIFSMRFGANEYRTPRYSYSSGGLSIYNPLTNTLTRSTKPTDGQLLGDGQSAALDLVASYNLGRTKQKTLVTVDYYDNIGHRPSYTQNTAVGPATVSVGSPTFVPYIPWTNLNSTGTGISPVGSAYTTTRLEWDYAKTLGVDLRQQAWAFDDKLIGVVGLRHDDVEIFQHSDLIPTSGVYAGQHVPDADFKGIGNTSLMAGFNIRITPDITYYASRSESFVPAQPSALVLTTNPVVVVPNQTGVGYETGFKIDALEHKLSFTTDVYDIQLHHVQITDIDPNDPTNTIVTFDGGQHSRGFEFDGNWQVTDKLTWIGTYSYTWSRATDRGVDLDAMSRQFAKIPYNQMGSALTYDLGNGFRVYTSTFYSGSAFVDTAGGITNAVTHLITTNNGQRTIKSPSYAVWNMGAAYKFKTPGRFTHTVNVSIKNMFNKFYVQPNRYVGDPLGFFASYTVAH